ncbi:MAG: cyclic pyranopterin monophosphate synthase MoaC [Planctomycetaceae bacterium]|nr:cyclic pyranopterin monophosphate synthase MoaC [Planctomycetaceae bacterium]
MGDLSHFDESGASRMVDVSGKESTLRMARASGVLMMDPATLSLIADRRLAKGDVLEVARLAGIMAAKRTGELIPLCHPLGLDSVEIGFSTVSPGTIRIEAVVKTCGKTGVEMEALTAVSISALTVYDMCKAVDQNMAIARIQLEEKTGGRRGHFRRDEVVVEVLGQASDAAESQGGVSALRNTVA